MKYFVFIGIGLMSFMVFGCSGKSKQIEKEPQKLEVNISDSIQEDIVELIEIDVTTETRHAYIKEVLTNNSELYIKADYADYLIDDEAYKAAMRDKAYFIDGEDTIVDITDGYYISNQNNKERIFKLSENAKINIFFVAKGSYEIEEIEGANLSQFEAHLGNNPLLILNIKEGVVIGIEEQFLP